MNTILSAILLVAWALPVSATDIGTYGDTWAIQEHDLIAVLRQRLQAHFSTQSPAAWARDRQHKAERAARRPPAVAGLVTGRDTHTRLFDPALILTRDIINPNGDVIAHQGQRVSPFDVLPAFDETLYFIDADDPRQTAWMQQQRPTTPAGIIILVKGSIRDSASAFGVRIYFDQNGSLTTRLGIQQVPARVTQAAGKPLLRITEFGLPDR